MSTARGALKKTEKVDSTLRFGVEAVIAQSSLCPVVVNFGKTQ
jgi:hypothetical protein